MLLLRFDHYKAILIFAIRKTVVYKEIGEKGFTLSRLSVKMIIMVSLAYYICMENLYNRRDVSMLNFGRCHSMSGGAVIAAMRGRIIRAFANANAFSETDAKTTEEMGLSHYAHGLFKRMVRRGIIIETNDHRFYINQTYYATRKRRKKVVLMIAVILLVAVAGALVYFNIFSR